MLAEPRRRQKWTLNPRGTLWSNDDNKFGQKLMEKMGWSKGKGLGRAEQGETEHVSLRMKDNTKGLGYKGKDDEWIKHYEGFENVLATLNSENNSAAASPCSSVPNSRLNSDDDEDSKVSSLEARSKSSQARVHYHKFTRGKDLSRYNADDIACITGSKRFKQLVEAKKKTEFVEDDVGNRDHTNGVTTIKAGNIQDYFSKKMALLKGRLNQPQGASGVDESENCDQEGEYLWEENGNTWQDWEDTEVTNCEDTEITKGKKKRKKEKITEDTEIQENTEISMKDCEGKIEKKKKSKKNRMILDSQSILEEKVNKKKKEVKVDKEDDDIDNETHDKEEPSEQEPRKKKKRRIVNDMQEDNDNEMQNLKESTVQEPPEKKKKVVLGTQENEDGSKIANERECYTKESRKKKKKKVIDAQENESDETQNEIKCTDNVEESRKKKKKKSRQEKESHS